MTNIPTLDRVYGGIVLDNGRTVPFDRVVGVAELAELFTTRLDEMVNINPRPYEITRSQVSTWASRHKTTHFPNPLPIRVARGLLWDLADFVDPETSRLLWVGPPGRWGDPYQTDSFGSGADPADEHPDIPQ